MTGLLGGGPLTYDGRYHRARRRREPPARAASAAARACSSAARATGCCGSSREHADGWNTCWAWTPDAYRERLAVLDAACARVGRDPATVWRTLGLYALCGEDEPISRAASSGCAPAPPPGVLDGVEPAEWRGAGSSARSRRCASRCGSGRRSGVETLILGAGAVPFQVAAPDDVAMFGSLCS